MKKSTYVSFASVLAMSALTPAVSIAAETPTETENALTGFYNVKTGVVVPVASFMFMTMEEKIKVITDQHAYFADGEGGAISSNHILDAETDKELDNKMITQAAVENEFNVKLTSDGRVFFLSLENASEALQDAINKAKEQLVQLTEEQKLAVENAIKEAEETLNNADATIEDLKSALDKLKDVLDNAQATDHLIKAAQDAVKLAQETKTEENINKAQELVNQLKDEAIKNELQAILDSLKKNAVDLSGFQELI